MSTGDATSERKCSCADGVATDAKNEDELIAAQQGKQKTLDLKAAAASYANTALTLAVMLFTQVGVEYGVAPVFNFKCGPGGEEVVKLPLLLYGTAMPKECPNYATWAISWYLASGGRRDLAAVDAVTLAKLNAVAKEWHSVLIKQCAGKRGTCMISKDFKDKTWLRFFGRLEKVVISSELSAAAGTLLSKSAATFKTDCMTWAKEALGPGWRTVSQVGHWDWQTPNQDYLFKAAPNGAIRPISALVIKVAMASSSDALGGSSISLGKPTEEMIDPNKKNYVRKDLTYGGFLALAGTGNTFVKTSKKQNQRKKTGVAVRVTFSSITVDSTEGKWIVDNEPTHTSKASLAAAFTVRVAHASSCAHSAFHNAHPMPQTTPLCTSPPPAD